MTNNDPEFMAKVWKKNMERNMNYGLNEFLADIIEIATYRPTPDERRAFWQGLIHATFWNTSGLLLLLWIIITFSG